MFSIQEANDRLSTIIEIIDQHQTSETPILTSTNNLLSVIRSIAMGEEIELPIHTKPTIDHVIISCDASIKTNPGGPASIGVVIQTPRNNKAITYSRLAKAVTSNQAEYEAIYDGLTTLMDISNHPGYMIEVRSDSQLAIKQLNGENKCHDIELAKKIHLIHELVRELPVQVKFVWRPRCSTPALQQANFLAQDILNVPRH